MYKYLHRRRKLSIGTPSAMDTSHTQASLLDLDATTVQDKTFWPEGNVDFVVSLAGITSAFLTPCV
jgi:hypothetical protein